MTKTSALILRTPATQLSITDLARLLKAIVWLQRVVAVSAVACLVIVGVQVSYPRSLARPLTFVDGQYAGVKPAAKISSLTKEYLQAKHKLAVGNSKYDVQLAAIGVNYDLSATEQGALSYSLGERLKPFSLFQRHKVSTVLHVDNQLLDRAVAQYSSENTKAAIKPSLRFTEHNYQMVAGAAGLKIDTAGLKDQLLRLPASNTSAVVYAGQVIQPTLQESTLKAAISQWQQQTEAGFTVTDSQTAYRAPNATVRDWLQLSVAADDTISYSYNSDAIKVWLATAVPAVLTPSLPAVTIIKDGQATVMSAGQAGRALATSQTIGAITTALSAGANQAAVVTVPYMASPRVQRSYSPTSAGLQSLLADWAASSRGREAVSLIELSNKGRSASLNASQPFITASLYKLFSALYLYTEISAGRLAASDQITPGVSYSSCLEKMIVVSDNNCPTAVGTKFGWGAITELAHSRGFSQTSLEASFTSTSADVAAYLQALASGKLLSPADSASLLSAMSRQVFRSGIPAGSAGCSVADKSRLLQ